MMILITTDYMENVMIPLDDPPYKKLARHHTSYGTENYSPHQGILTS
jgi:hypothetical protein